MPSDAKIQSFSSMASFMQRHPTNWKTIIFSTITFILLVGTLVTGQSLRQQIRYQTESLDNNLVKTIHDLNQLQREIYQLQLWILTTQGPLERSAFQQQLDITQSRFTIIKRRQQIQDLHPHVVDSLRQLDQDWGNLQTDIQRWNQQPTDPRLQKHIIDALTQLEIDANKAAILNSQQQWMSYQHLVQRSSNSLQLLSIITALFLGFGLFFGVLLAKFILTRQHLLKDLERSATIDDLTQIPNRRYFNQVFDQEWQRMQREQSPLSILLCDVDYFKLYNDHYGHQAGDQCLVAIASTLNQCMRRPADIVARYGGEEFIILLPNTQLQGAQQQADLIQQQLATLALPHQQSPISQHITISIGLVSQIPNHCYSATQLIANADKALYQAKAQGRNCSCQYKP